MNIYVPKMEEVITVEGTLLYEDGKAVADAYVEFKADNASSSIEGKVHAKTDTNGRFSIKILKGLKGKLYGLMYSYAGEFENCPKLDEFLRKTGEREVKTDALEIRADENLSKIVLKYSFPYCKKAR